MNSFVIAFLFAMGIITALMFGRFIIGGIVTFVCLVFGVVCAAVIFLGAWLIDTYRSLKSKWRNK